MYSKDAKNRIDSAITEAFSGPRETAENALWRARHAPAERGEPAAYGGVFGSQPNYGI